MASYYFYMNWEPVYAILLLTSTIVTYFAALSIGHFKEKRKKKLCLVKKKEVVPRKRIGIKSCDTFPVQVL